MATANPVWKPTPVATQGYRPNLYLPPTKSTFSNLSNSAAYAAGAKPTAASMGIPSNSGGGYGGSYGGGGSSGGYTAPQTSFDWGAYMAQMQAEREAQLRAMTDSANSQIDANAASSIKQAENDERERLIQGNIRYQKAQQALPQQALISGGGGATESALLDMNTSYGNERNQTEETKSRAVAGIRQAADAQKNSNWQNLTSNLMTFQDQLSQYAMQLAAQGGAQYANILPALMGQNSSGTSANAYATLKAQGLSDEEIRRRLGY